MLNLEIRQPRDDGEISAFLEICELNRLPKCLGEIDGIKVKGLIAAIDGTVIGGVNYQVCGTGEQRLAFLDALAVHPDYHGLGVGKKLHANLASLLREEGVREVKAVPTNENNIAFYKSQGWVEDQTSPDFVRFIL